MMNRNRCTGSVALVCMLMLLLLSGCKSSRLATGMAESGYLSSKVHLTLPQKEGSITVSGNMRLKSGERMQLSFLMPILRSEVVRLEVTPEELLLVDRMGKRYVRATRKELKGVLPKKATFARLEKLLYAATTPDGKRALTAQELGLPSLKRGKIELSDFSDKPFTMTPTQLSKKYEEVSPEELLEMLAHLLN